MYTYRQSILVDVNHSGTAAVSFGPSNTIRNQDQTFLPFYMDASIEENSRSLLNAERTKYISLEVRWKAI
jgi:hypothetical protein